MCSLCITESVQPQAAIQLLVQFSESGETFVLSLGSSFSLFEQLFSSFGVGLSQTAVTVFILDEFLVVAGGFLAVQSEGILAFCLRAGLYRNICQ